MQGRIDIRRERLIGEIQKDFSQAYPYLKIDFYRVKGNAKYKTAEKLDKSMALYTADIHREGELVLSDTMTVLELERRFREEFGAYVQVSRKSGILWLETTMTDNWSLKQQNDNGRELSEPARSIKDEIDYN